jgi:hypothetical protein
VSNVFLGIIAISVLVMATIQVALIVFAAKAAKRVGDVVSRLESDVRPIVENLKTMTADAARASASAATQVERVQQSVETLAQRVDEIVVAFREQILAPARDGLAFLQGFKSILSILRDGGSGAGRSASRARQSHVEDEDALFIG